MMWPAQLFISMIFLINHSIYLSAPQSRGTLLLKLNSSPANFNSLFYSNVNLTLDNI